MPEARNEVSNPQYLASSNSWLAEGGMTKLIQSSEARTFCSLAGCGGSPLTEKTMQTGLELPITSLERSSSSTRIISKAYKHALHPELQAVRLAESDL